MASAKLTYENSWESDTYKVDGKRVRNLTKVKIGGQVYKVTGKTVGVPYSDMGQPGMGVSTHYYVKERVFGMDKLFDLNEIVPNKSVYAVEYEIEGER